MSYQPNRWAIGLVPVAVLWVLGTVGAEKDLPRELSASVRAAVGEDVDGATVRTDGRDVSLSGEAYTHARQQTAIDKALAAPGVRSLDSHDLGLIPTVSPYVWWVVRDGGRVTTSGAVPDVQTKTAIAAAVKGLGASDALDRTTFGRGDSADLPAAAAWATKVLANFTRGSAVFTDGALEVSGTARDGAAYTQALALLKAPPEGVKVSSADVTPPVASPFVFSAAKPDAGVSLAGGAVSESEKAALAALAGKLFAGAKIDDKLAIQSGAPGGEAAAAKWALGALGVLASGKAEAKDNAITLAGKASGPGDIEALGVRAALARRIA